MTAAVIDILDAERNEPLLRTWAYIGVDFTGSTFKMQVRQSKDTTGTPFVNTSSTTGGVISPYHATDTVANHVSAGRLDKSIYSVTNDATGAKYAASDSVLVSQLQVFIDILTMQGIPKAGEVGDDLNCWYDIIRDPGFSPVLLQKGKFVVLGGVTLP